MLFKRKRSASKNRSPFSASPWAAVITTLGVALLGIIASFDYQSLIDSPPVSWAKTLVEYNHCLSGEPKVYKESPFQGAIFGWLDAASCDLEFSSKWNANAVAYWIIFIVSALLIGRRERHKQKASKEGHESLTNNIARVQDLASTMPPKSHLSKTAFDFEAVSFEAETAYFKALKDLNFIGPDGQGEAGESNPPVVEKNCDMLNETIRVVLDSIINLAMHFDKEKIGRPGKYSANIMWLDYPWDFSSVSSQERLWEAADRLSDCGCAAEFLAKVDAILVLDVNLTTNSETLGKPIVDNLKPLCLGYKNGSSGEGYNLPGAPQAVASIDYSYVADSQEIAGSLFEYGKCSKDKVARYYQNDSRGRSILSMPLKGYDPQIAGEQLLGVVSIYRDQPGIMWNEERAAMFYYQMIPSYLALLYRLCWARRQFDPLGYLPFDRYTEKQDSANTASEGGQHDQSSNPAR